MFGSDYAWILQGSPKDVPWWSDAANTVCSPAALMAAVEGLLLVSSHNSLAGPEPSLSGLVSILSENYVTWCVDYSTEYNKRQKPFRLQSCKLLYT
jgi:hypothetical protein